jgi:5-methylcytosine-specific restriction protein B
MADYFTSDHFKLLNKWKGQKRDESNPEQNRAYEDLKTAYEVTEAWANEVKVKLFPTGMVKLRKRPTSQGNSFQPYNWARIYPSSESPKALAYTVGIDVKDGFVVKIDTVGVDDSDPIRHA